MDRMDDIWKDRFNSEELPAEDWNSPDDFVWESVAAQTVRKDKRRLMAWWFLGLLVLALSIFSIYMLRSANAAVLNSEDTEIPALTMKDDSKVAPNPNTSLEKESSLSSSDSYQTKQINTQKETALTTQINNNTNPFNNTITKSPNNTAPKVATAGVNTITQNNTAQEATNPNSLATFSTTSLDQRQEQIAPDLTKELSVESPALTNQSVVLLKTVNTLLENENFTAGNRAVEVLKKRNPLYLTLHSGATYWQHNISQQYTSDLSDFDFNYTDELGLLLGLDLGIPVGKRFMLQLGMNYEQVNISSGHNSSLSYDPSQESDAPHNDYALSLATPYGLSAAEFSFVRAENIGDDPVDLLVDFHSAHTIQNFSMPIGFLFAPFGNRNRFSPYVQASFGINYLRKLSNDIASIDTDHSAIRYDDSGSSNFQSPDIERWHYDYRMGIGAAYRLSPKLSVRLDYQYARGINAIFQQDNYNTRINRHHISIGLSRSISSFP